MVEQQDAKTETRRRELIGIMAKHSPNSEVFRDAQKEYVKLSPTYKLSPYEPPPETQLKYKPSSIQPQKLSQHIDFLLKLLEENESTLQTTDPNSRTYRNALKNIQALEKEIPLYLYLLRDEDTRSNIVRTQTSNGRVTIVKGLAILLISALISGVWYLASGPGDTYIVFWGAMAAGVAMVVSGAGKLIDRW